MADHLDDSISITLEGTFFRFLGLYFRPQIARPLVLGWTFPLTKGEANPKTVHSSILGPDEECLLVAIQNQLNL